MFVVILIAICVIVYCIYLIGKRKSEREDRKERVFRTVANGGKLSPEDQEYYNYLTAYAGKTPTKSESSVVGSAVVGGIIAGPAGAVVGAVSAADKNNKIRAEKASKQ